jgi:hypothetical protein
MKRVFAGILLAAACESSDLPVDPVWSKQACSSCGMIVGDRHTAAEVLTKSDERIFFDDPGCMLAWLSSHPNQEKHAWVKDAQGTSWLDAHTAKWNSGAATPMDYGWTASANDGQSFDEMRAAVLAREGSKR